MTEPNTEAIDLAAIIARAEAATEGPWQPEPLNPGWVLAPPDHGFERMVCRGMPTSDDNKVNGEFIAHARTDVPLLLAALAAAVARAEKAEAENVDWARYTRSLHDETGNMLDATAARAEAAEAERDALKAERDEMGEQEWGTLLPSGTVCRWDDKRQAGRAAAMSRSFPGGEHPLMSRFVGPWLPVSGDGNGDDG